MAMATGQLVWQIHRGQKNDVFGDGFRKWNLFVRRNRTCTPCRNAHRATCTHDLRRHIEIAHVGTAYMKLKKGGGLAPERKHWWWVGLGRPLREGHGTPIRVLEFQNAEWDSGSYTLGLQRRVLGMLLHSSPSPTTAALSIRLLHSRRSCSCPALSKYGCPVPLVMCARCHRICRTVVSINITAERGAVEHLKFKSHAKTNATTLAAPFIWWLWRLM